MCKAMKDHDLEKEVAGSVKLARKLLGNNEKEVVQVVSSQYEVTPQFVNKVIKKWAPIGVTTSQPGGI